MFNCLFYFCLFVFIETINIFNVTENYEGELKNNLNDKTNKNVQEFFFVNTEEKIYKSFITNGSGSTINNDLLNISDNSSIIYTSESNFLIACTKDYLLGKIDSNLIPSIIQKENKIKEITIKTENKCNLLYSNLNQDKTYLILSYSNENNYYVFFACDINLNENKIEDCGKSQPNENVDENSKYKPYFISFNNNEYIFNSFLESSADSTINNVIYISTLKKEDQSNIIGFPYNQKIKFANIHPIGAFPSNDSGIFYGFDTSTNNSLFFCIPKFKINTDNNKIEEFTCNNNFSIDYDGFIKNYTAYETIKASYLNETHFILNYLYKKNILKVKLININKSEKVIFDFNLELSETNTIKTYFNYILSDYNFSYLLSTETEKYYFIIKYKNCDVEHCGICFEDSNDETNEQCIKCDEGYIKNCLSEGIIKSTKSCHIKTDNINECYLNDDNNENFFCSNIFNLTNDYKNELKHSILNNSEFFLVNTDEKMYKSFISNGSIAKEIISLNFIEKSSIIYISNLDIFAVACTKDFLLGIINSDLNLEIFNNTKSDNSILIDQKDNKCNLLYYYNNSETDENKMHQLILSFVESRYIYNFTILKNKSLNYDNITTNIEIEHFNYEPYFFLYTNKNNFFFSYLIIENNISSNVLYMSTNYTHYFYTINITLNYTYPIGAFPYNDSMVFYGFNSSNENIVFCIPKYNINSSNLVDALTGENNFSIEYDGEIENYTDYNTIKASYLNKTHFILSYLYKEYILKVKIINIGNIENIEKDKFNFYLELSDTNTIKTYFNYILSDYSFSYLLSTETEKYYFIINKNCEVENQGENEEKKCKIYAKYYPNIFFNKINNDEIYCVSKNPIDYHSEMDKIEYICQDNDYINENIYPQWYLKYINNYKCKKCADNYPYRLFNETKKDEFNCYDKCPDGTIPDIINHICYDSCLKNCSDCKNYNKCTKCADNYPYRLSNETENEEFDCYDKCPDGTTQDINNHICYVCLENCSTCINNKKCTKCAENYPYKLIDEPNQTEFDCYNECPNGYLSDEIEHICYKSCNVKCSNCIYRNKCTKCGEEPYRFFENLDSNKYKCKEFCPNIYLADKNEKTCNFTQCPSNYEYYKGYCRLNLSYIISTLKENLENYINQNLVYDDYIIQCYYYNENNIKKFNDNLSSKIELNLNNLRRLTEKNLILFKLDIVREDHLLNQVEYKVFDEDKNEINLEDTQIQISIPVSNKKNMSAQMEEDYKVFTNETIRWNSSSEFYNDICEIYNENNSDIVIEDRKNLFYPNNITIFDENCEFLSIENDVIKVLCDYKPNITITNRTFSENKKHESFNITRNYDFNILKCINKKFYKSYLFWICLALTIIQLIIFFYIFKYIICVDEEINTPATSKPEKEENDMKKIQINILKEISLEENESNKKKMGKSNTLKSNNSDSSSKGLKLKVVKEINFENENNDNDDNNDKNSDFIDNGDKNGKGIISHFGFNAGGNLNHKLDKNKNQKKNILIDSNESNDKEKESNSMVLESEENQNESSKNNGLSLKVIDDKSSDQIKSCEVTEVHKFEYSKRIHKNFINDEEFKFMNYNDQVNEQEYSEEVVQEDNKKKTNINLNFCSIYRHYFKYNELIFFTFVNNKDFNHKYLKVSLFVFYLDFIILFNVFFFSEKLVSKAYNNHGYPFKDCLGLNILIIFIVYIAVAIVSKVFLRTHYYIIYRIKEEKILKIKEEEEKKENNEQKEENSNQNENEVEKLGVEGFNQKIKEDKQKIIESEIRKKEINLLVYFIGVGLVFFYSFTHAMAFGIVFEKSQKFILINLLVCYVLGFFISLLYNILCSLLRYFGEKNKKIKLFNWSLYCTLTI